MLIVLLNVVESGVEISRNDDLSFSRPSEYFPSRFKSNPGIGAIFKEDFLVDNTQGEEYLSKVIGGGGDGREFWTCVVRQ